MIERIAITDLVAGGWRALAFTPFRDGIEIAHLYEDASGASAAVLRYAPGASAPLHVHQGFEHVLILEGGQSDEFGDYGVGDLTVNPPGLRHSLTSPNGCVALLIWQQPVKFVDEK